ncbi:hypothetical protein EC957_000604 [Mortierella hygrophila]|uniref:Beta-lactamase/transpeptidase-like protein n=1 Tax=Mortierella hygrophila TaxID=979708 RepID=A0A9P6F6R5_9FUNG|nr:hypothetical protein EC957_000604 [Mortierella hygrophila]
MTTTTTAPAPHDNKEFLANLPDVLEKARADGGIPGMSVAILHKGDLVFAQGFGKRNRNDPFTKETVTHIASVSKAFTATAVGELVAEGKVDWNKTPVSEYLPEFQLKDPLLTSLLTFADLLSHRTPLPSIDMAWYRNSRPPKELIKQLRHVDIPSSKMTPFMNYNNILYAVAGEAAANVAGVSYSELIKNKIFGPLGLRSAGLSHLEMARQSNYAMPYDADSFDDARNGIFEEGFFDPIPMADAPAGDIFMNAMDLAKWGRVILKEGELDGKQVLNKKSIQETLKAQSIVDDDERRPGFSPTLGYGLGWMLDSYKGGSNPGYQSNLAFFPDDDLVVAHLTNIDVTELPFSLLHYIADGMLGLPTTIEWLSDETAIQETRETYEEVAKDLEGGDDFPERIENQPPSHTLADYAGVYTHPVYDTITICLEEEDASLHLKMRTLDSKVEHYHFELFTALLRDFGVKSLVPLTFITANNGRVEGLRTILDDDVVLEFKREEKEEKEEGGGSVVLSYIDKRA